MAWAISRRPPMVSIFLSTYCIILYTSALTERLVRSVAMGELCTTLESLAASDCDSYYHGDVMKKIVAFSKETGGFFQESDFTGYKAQWVEPIEL